MEKVSFIVPVYNGEQRLKRCVESILNQDYEELELILVDDGSRDGSWERMRELAESDSRIRAVHKENGGVSSARNRGLAEAGGTYVQFADVDDWLPMDATKLLVREMEQNRTELAVGGFYRVVDGNVSQKGDIAEGGILSRREYADHMMRSPADLYYGVLWNKLYRRDIIEQYGIRMDENISYSEDMIFNLEYLLHVSRISVVKAPVYYYQYTRGSLVDQSLNLSSTIRMKKSVIGYYNEFFKSTFDAPDYQERLPVIYSYLLAVSRDSLALPFAPGTQKLSAADDLPLFSEDTGKRVPMQNSVLSEQLLLRYLETAALRHDMETNELLLLYCMRELGRPCSAEALSSLSRMGKTAVILNLARLLSRGLVRRVASDGRGERFVFQAPQLEEELLQLDQDMDAVRFAGFTDGERQEYRDFEARISESILRHLRAEKPTGSE